MKLILFDIDGTIIDSSEGITKSAQYALKAFGIDEPDLKKLLCFIGPPLVGSFMKYGNMTEEEGIKAVEKYRERYLVTGIFECKLYEGVRDTLIRLKEEGYLLGTASSKPEVSVKRILDYFEISDLFDCIVGATPDGRISTKEEVLREVFSRMPDINPDEALLVGDTIYDIEGANQAGLKSIGVSFGFGNTNEMISAGAICICDSFPEIADAVSREL